jgi:hypothetical protein
MVRTVGIILLIPLVNWVGMPEGVRVAGDMARDLVREARSRTAMTVPAVRMEMQGLNLTIPLHNMEM